jgi:hypothetical protein
MAVNILPLPSVRATSLDFDRIRSLMGAATPAAGHKLLETAASIAHTHPSPGVNILAMISQLSPNVQAALRMRGRASAGLTDAAPASSQGDAGMVERAEMPASMPVEAANAVKVVKTAPVGPPSMASCIPTSHATVANEASCSCTCAVHSVEVRPTRPFGGTSPQSMSYPFLLGSGRCGAIGST